MKQRLIFIGLSVAGILFAEDRGPVLHYDFTAPVIQQGGIYKQPALPSDVKMASPEQALILAGGMWQKELVVPESAGFSLAEGAAFYALVRFDQDGKKGGQNDAHDMILFKNKDMLFGRSCGDLYFNIGTEDKWVCSITAPKIPTKRWTALAATVTKNGEANYTIRLYIDGRKAAEKKFQKKIDAPNSNPITIGKGWGGPWLFCGLLGRIMIFDRALTDDQIAGLSAQEPLLKK